MKMYPSWSPGLTFSRENTTQGKKHKPMVEAADKMLILSLELSSGTNQSHLVHAGRLKEELVSTSVEEC